MPIGTAVTHDASLPLRETKRAKALAVTGKDSCPKWSKTTKEANEISEKFAHLVTERQLVIVTPHVPKEIVVALHIELKKLITTSSLRCAGTSI